MGLNGNLGSKNPSTNACSYGVFTFDPKGRYFGIFSSRLKRWCSTEEETDLVSFSQRTLYYGRYIAMFDFIRSKSFEAPLPGVKNGGGGGSRAFLSEKLLDM